MSCKDRSRNRVLTLVLILGVLIVGALPAEASFIFVPRPRDGMRHMPPRPPRRPLVHLVSEEVDVAIEDGVATVRIEDRFRNDGHGLGEGDVIMPLPEGTVLLQMSIFINGEEVKGEVLDRDAAAKVYTDIVRQMRDPLLAEWAGKNLVRVRLFPIPAGGEQRVRVEYATVLPVDHRLSRFTYPMKGAGGGQANGRGHSPELRLRVGLRAAKDVRNVYSPSHDVEIDVKSARHVAVDLKDRRIDPTRDFVLVYSVSDDDVGFGLLPHRKGGQDGYFLMTFQPKTARKAQRPPSQTVWVLDVSGSMSGLKLKKAKEALRFGINRLRDEDSFNIIAFSSDTDSLFDQLVAGDGAHKDEALAFVDELEAEGGTDIDSALRLALGGMADKGVNVVFLTDGEPTVGETKPRRILERAEKANRDHARMFVFGVGDEVNTHLLDKLAKDNNGMSLYVRPDAEIEVVVSHFFAKVSWPAVTDLRVRVKGSGIRIDKMSPRQIPFLFRGDQLVVLGRYRGEGKATVVLTGTVGREEKTWEFKGEFPKRARGNGFVSKLWATRRVAFLLQEIRLNGEKRELRDEVERLGKRFGIVTPYTSYLIKEEERSLARDRGQRRDNRPSPVAQNLEARRAKRKAPRAPAARGMDGAGGKAAGTRSGGLAGFFSGAGDAPAAEVLADSSGFQSQAGSASVAAAKSLGAMEHAATLSETDRSSVVTVRRASGRSFSYDGDAWVDEDAETPTQTGASPGGLETVEIVYLSDLYFALLREVPGLRDALSLGDQIRIRVNGFVLSIGDRGLSDSDPALVERIRASFVD